MWDIRNIKQSFVRSGHVYLYRGVLRYSGMHDYDYSSIAFRYFSPTSADTYYLDVQPTMVHPSYGPWDRWYGFHVRCLVILC